MEEDTDKDMTEDGTGLKLKRNKIWWDWEPKDTYWFGTHQISDTIWLPHHSCILIAQFGLRDQVALDVIFLNGWDW